MKTKTASVRFDKNMLVEIDNRCEKVGCSRNDFVKNALDFAMNGHTDFDFGDEASEKAPASVTASSEINKKAGLENNTHESHYDEFGNYWYFNKNKDKWVCRINMDNVKVKP